MKGGLRALPTVASQTHAAFFYAGINVSRSLPTGHCANLGQLELINELTIFASVMADMQERAAAIVNEQYPGVFEYDVAEEFGVWYGWHVESTGLLPTDELAIEAMGNMIYSFFSRGDVLNIPALRAALAVSYDVEGLRRLRVKVPIRVRVQHLISAMGLWWRS